MSGSTSRSTCPFGTLLLQLHLTLATYRSAGNSTGEKAMASAGHEPVRTAAAAAAAGAVTAGVAGGTRLRMGIRTVAGLRMIHD